MINTNNDYIFGYENALSVFDGMSCGQLALQRAGIKVENYFASEIDKYAMQVAKNNFPNTKFIGDVTKINYSNLPKADLLIGGSPCQGFSFAGKQLNFEDPRSKLFFEFVKARDKNPNADFLLENVKMKKEYQDVITSYLGVEPVEINSALVSAQNRKRLYWTNIGHISQPEDKSIMLKDIVHEYALCDREKSNCVTAGFQNTSPKDYYERKQGQYVFQTNINPSGNGMNGNVRSIYNDKSNCLTTNKGEGQKIWVDINDYKIDFDKAIKILEAEHAKGKIILNNISKTDHVTTLNPIKLTGTQTYQQDRVYTIHGKMVCLSAELSGRFNVFIEDEYLFGCITPDWLEKRQNGQRFNDGNKFYTLTAQDKHGILIEGYIRKLTPIECERLQTVPDNYTAGVSNSQRYKMLGNGWTIDVIKHILLSNPLI